MSTELTAAQVRRLATIRPDLLFWATLTWIGYFGPPLLIGWLTRLIFERLTDEPAVGSLWSLVVLLLLTQLSRELIQWVWLSFNMRYFGHTEGLLRQQLWRNLLNRPEISARATAGTLVTYMRADTETVSDIINEWYRLVGEGVFFIVALAVMVSINPWIALLANLPLAAIAFVVHQLGAPLQRRIQAERVASGRVTGFIGEIMGAILAVKVAGAAAPVGRHFSALNDARRQAALAYTLTGAIIDSLGNNLVLIGRGLILLLVAYSVNEGARFSVGDFALFIIYLGWMLEFPRRVGRLLAIRRSGAVAGRRLLSLIQGDLHLSGVEIAKFDLFTPRPLHLEGEPAPYVPAESVNDPLLQTLAVEELSYHYPNGTAGIKKVSFTVERGQLVVITGAIGAGKTTLLRALLGLLPGVTGRLSLNGISLAPTDLRPPLAAYTPQIPQLFSASLADNIRLGWPADADSVEAALALAALGPDLAQFPAGLATQVGVRGVRLSGGQIQRTALARQLVRAPQLLLIDDLSSALDVATEVQLWATLRALPGQSFLVVSHRPALLAEADKILVLADGRLVAQGSYNDLKRQALLPE